MRPLLKTSRRPLDRHRRLHPLQPGTNDIPLKTWRSFMNAPPAQWSPFDTLRAVEQTFRSGPHLSAV
jgi:hypothetical protein